MTTARTTNDNTNSTSEMTSLEKKAVYKLAKKSFEGMIELQKTMDAFLNHNRDRRRRTKPNDGNHSEGSDSEDENENDNGDDDDGNYGSSLFSSLDLSNLDTVNESTSASDLFPKPQKRERDDDSSDDDDDDDDNGKPSSQFKPPLKRERDCDSSSSEDRWPTRKVVKREQYLSSSDEG
eukprot:CAMPEP_0197246088 /NCGR_PEP_ID=MMETSP1429-20130617/10659_1 /TAXON_ID=49237 /ORGANISM="Chaetoceros  sp., Strain UNC1202" /LENGTH=178 /DNA_ID=CAMNT_0042706691 /DNA_START=23 /DNA_END=559 /DNA_ORIENTATION=-